MDKKQTEQFFKELALLTEKYKLKNCVFGGEDSEGKFQGGFNIDRPGKSTFVTVMESIFNCAKLYQSGREKILKIFDDISRVK